MNDAPGRLFLDYSARKLHQLSERIETCLSKLDDERIWARGSDNENAAGNLVLHLCGNVRQWIIAGVGGQKDVRERDAEFSARSGPGAEELARRLRTTVDEASAVIGALPVERLSDRLTVQLYEVSVLEAIFHVVEHFSMHTGQIMFATKQLTEADLAFYKHLTSDAPRGRQTP